MLNELLFMKVPVSLCILLVMLHSLFFGSTVQKACERKAIAASRFNVNGEASALGLFLVPAHGVAHRSIRLDNGGGIFKLISIVHAVLSYGSRMQWVVSSLLFLQIVYHTIPLFIKGMTLRL